jgi:DNA mismatch repair protein MutS2
VIYPKNFETKTGFDKVRQMIRDNCLSPVGVQHVENLTFTTDATLIRQQLNQTEEFRQLMLEESGFPSQDYFDLTYELHRIKIEGTYIEQENLFDLKSSLITISDILQFFKKSDPQKFPNLISLSSEIFVDKMIVSSIEGIIDNKGNIKNNASAKLAEIRKSLSKEQASVDRKMRKAMSEAKRAGWTKDDTEVTIREGRPVIPVAAAHKRAIKGLIHDESATGQTVYIEPVEVFEIHNKIRELESAERREIINILKNFSGFVRPEIPNLIEAYKFLGMIDFIRAKASFALKINALKPKITDQPLVRWNKAVHPLLYLSHKKQNRPVVPLNIQLDNERRILVISGPNAGGKSVCLTTVGLLQYMLQCGLLIPVKDDSMTGIFQNLFIDIGDEQSLENDLSTYSSHLLNMKYFVIHSDANTLFLIDEFGTGTEPQLGGAIAESVLEKLNSNKAFGVVTTHYSNLKLMSKEGNGIVNGAMLFDTKAMQPLFSLKIGKPGSSFAFEIARKIGFPKEVLKNAEKKTGKKQLDFDEQLQQLDIERKELEKKRVEVGVADNFLSEMIDKYEKLSRDLKLKKEEIIEKARQEALEIVDSSNKLIENTIKEIRETQADKEKTKKLRQELEKEKERIVEKTVSEKKFKTGKQKNESGPTKNKVEVTRPVAVGDIVKLKEQGVTAEVISIKGRDVVLSFNSITLKTTLDRIEKTGKIKAPQKPASGRNRYSSYTDEINKKMANFNLQIDVRGKRGEEALDIVKHYIDDAILLNIGEVRILHGKGYGTLRSLIHDYLNTIPEIKSFKDEHIERGGHGITVVVFK